MIRWILERFPHSSSQYPKLTDLASDMRLTRDIQYCIARLRHPESSMVLSTPQQCHLLPLLSSPCPFIHDYCMRDGRCPGKSLGKPTEWYGCGSFASQISAVTPTYDKQGLFALSTTSDSSPTNMHLALPNKTGRLLSARRSKPCTTISIADVTFKLLVLASLIYDSEHPSPSPTTTELLPSCASNTHH